METALSLLIGLGLSAACGFRVFVPLLALSLAAHSGHVHLSSSFAWLGSYPAIVTFSLATLLEIAGYYVPVFDNFLDSVATPAAVVAGTIVAASFISDVSPFLKWTLAAIAGGGAAGLVQSSTVLARAASTGGTAGLANPLLSTAELGGSLIASLLALLVPVLAGCVALVVLILAARWLFRWRNSRNLV